jgi:protein-S-isoprenylcysteine O-methyltransferase Ste14
VRAFGERGGWWLVAQGVVLAVTFALGFVGPGWPAARPLLVAGVVLGAVGLVLVVAAIGALGSAATPFPKPRADATLRSHGPYRFVRHPIYAGLIVASLGWSLVTRPLALAGAAALGIFFDRKAEREEAWLVEHDPAYAGYRAGVRWRFFPGVR